MPIIKYRVVPYDVEGELPEDPPEEWVQEGVNYPQGDPPPGVMSPTDAIPEIRQPNHVPPEPPHVEEVVPDEPEPSQPETYPPEEPIR